MKYLLAGSLCFIFSTFSSVTSATDSLEYTIRQIYQPYIESTPVATFGGAMVSARMGQALTLDERLTLPGDMGWLGYDPICNCQDFDNLVLENVAITRKDASHAEATVRFRPFRDRSESVTQTLSMMMENHRWVIDDIIRIACTSSSTPATSKPSPRCRRCRDRALKISSVRCTSILTIIPGRGHGWFHPIMTR